MSFSSDKTDDEVIKILDELRYILNREIAYDTAEKTALAAAIDLHYTAAWSTIQNCDRRFRTLCPKRWAELALTTERLTRWCSICERHVIFCMSDGEIDRLSQAGECVAFYDRNESVETIGLIEFDDKDR